MHGSCRLPLGSVGSPSSSTNSTPVFSARHRSNTITQNAVPSMSEEDLAREIARLEQENQNLEKELGASEDVQQKLISKATALQQSTEVEEEAMSLGLLRKMESAKRDVQQYKRQIKTEESSHKKLRLQIEDVKRQQIDMENQLEQEQEFLLLKLQKQVMETNNRKMEIERELAQERAQYLEVLHNQLRQLMANTPTVSLAKIREATSSTTTGRPRSDSQMSTGSNALPSSRSVTPHMSLMRVEDGPASAGNPLGDSITTESPTALRSSSLTRSPCPGGVASLAAFHTDPHRAVHTPTSGESTPVRPRARSTSILATPTTPTIAELERKVNELLQVHAQHHQQAMQREEKCVALSVKLHDLQQRQFLDGAKASKLNEDLQKVKAELAVLQTTSNVATNLSSSSHQRTFSEDSSTVSSFVPHVVASTLSLRDRTKELLSTPRVNLLSNSNSRRQRGGSQVSTTRSMSPPLHSGYTSGVETSSRLGSNLGIRPAPPPGAAKPVVRGLNATTGSSVAGDGGSSSRLLGGTDVADLSMVTDLGTESDRSLCVATPE